jgi:hypothetical protein
MHRQILFRSHFLFPHPVLLIRGLTVKNLVPVWGLGPALHVRFWNPRLLLYLRQRGLPKLPGSDVEDGGRLPISNDFGSSLVGIGVPAFHHCGSTGLSS